MRTAFSSTWHITSPTWATPGQSRYSFSAVVAPERPTFPTAVSFVEGRRRVRRTRQICCCRGGTSPFHGRGECGLDVGQKRRLILLDEPQVMPLGVENLLAQVALAEHRVTGDQAAFQHQPLQQPEGGLVFIGLVDTAVGDLRLSDRQPRLGATSDSRCTAWFRLLKLPRAVFPSKAQAWGGARYPGAVGSTRSRPTGSERSRMRSGSRR